MRVHDVPQRSDAWMALRCGKLTSSAAADMLATVKKGEAAARRNLRVRLALERLTGVVQPTYTSPAMQQGIDRENDALSQYEVRTGYVLGTTGFIEHDEVAAGCSPDAIVGDMEGLVEVKCPIPATHLEYRKSGIVPADYLAQVRHHLWITEAPWCDWVSYSPEFPEGKRLKVVRIARDPTEMAAYELIVRAFLAEVDAEVATILEVF